MPQNTPTTPPPTQIPTKPQGSYIIDCMYSYTYIWLKSGQTFWYYPTSLEEGKITGYAWNGWHWTFFGFDPKLIDEVSCRPIPTLY